jgi:hypothetical protein
MKSDVDSCLPAAVADVITNKRGHGVVHASRDLNFDNRTDEFHFNFEILKRHLGMVAFNTGAWTNAETRKVGVEASATQEKKERPKLGNLSDLLRLPVSSLKDTHEYYPKSIEETKSCTQGNQDHGSRRHRMKIGLPSGLYPTYSKRNSPTTIPRNAAGNRIAAPAPRPRTSKTNAPTPTMRNT